MIQKIAISLMVLIPLFLGNCSDSTGETEYRTQYGIDFSRIDDGVSIDSAKVRIYVNGEIVDSTFFEKDEILNQKVTISGIMSSSGDSVKVEYIVWSNNVVVAQGADSFVPSDNPAEDTDLQIDTNGVAIVLQQIEGNSSSNGTSLHTSSSEDSDLSSARNSSSSAAVPQEATCGTSTFSVGFSKDLANVREGVATLKLLIGGVEGTKTTKPSTVVLKVKSGSTDIQIPDVNVLVQANTAACSEVPFDVNVLSDQLVEAPETAVIQIADLGGFAAGEFQSQSLNIEDGDSAWVTIEDLPVSVTEPRNDSVVTVPLVLHTSNNATLAVAVNASFTLESTTLKVSTDYTVGSGITFPVTSDSGTILNIPLTLKANTVAEGTKTATLQAKVNSGPATASPQSSSLEIPDNEFEYLFLMNSLGEVRVYDPKGNKLGEISVEGTTLTSAGENHFVTSTGALENDYKVYTQLANGTFASTATITVALSGSTENLTSKDKYDMSIGETYSSSGFLFAGVTAAGFNVGRLDTTGGNWKLTFLGGYGIGSRFVSVDPSTHAGDSIFCSGGSNLYHFDLNSKGLVTQTTVGNDTNDVVGGLAISKTGEIMAYHKDGLMYYSSHSSSAFAVQPKGVTIGNMADIIATQVGTFWLINAGSTEDVSFAYEVDKTGAVLHTIPNIHSSTNYRAGTWVRTSRPIVFQ